MLLCGDKATLCMCVQGWMQAWCGRGDAGTVDLNVFCTLKSHILKKQPDLGLLNLCLEGVWATKVLHVSVLAFPFSPITPTLSKTCEVHHVHRLPSVTSKLLWLWAAFSVLIHYQPFFLLRLRSKIDGTYLVLVGGGLCSHPHSRAAPCCSLPHQKRLKGLRETWLQQDWALKK